MREINGKKFSLALIDTGIISEVVKDGNNVERLGLVRRIIDQNVIPCISIWTILELRRKPNVYQSFLEIFSEIPFTLIKTPQQIFEEELSAYPEPSKVEPVAIALTTLNEEPDSKPKEFLLKLFDDPEVRDGEVSWTGKWKTEGLKSMLSLRENFETKDGKFGANDAQKFIEDGVPSHLVSMAPEWVKTRLNNNESISPHAFWSVKMAFYTVFYRFYGNQRNPEDQDVFDILIHNVAPYMDLVITERFQAEIFKKVKSRDPFIKHLEILTASDIRPII